jgi:hypothetical protein
MSDPYNEYPSYPVAPCDGTGYYPQDGQYDKPPYPYEEPYGHEVPQDYHNPSGYGLNEPPQPYRIHSPEGPSFGTIQENPFEPPAGPHPGTEVDPYEPQSPGANMSY